MQIVIEPKDLREVKRVAKRYFGILLNDIQAELIARRDVEVQAGLLRGSLSDTMERDYLIDAIIAWVMEGVERHVVDDLFEEEDHVPEGWHWPCNGSSEEYRKVFNSTFRNCAKTLGVKLDKKTWENAEV